MSASCYVGSILIARARDPLGLRAPRIADPWRRPKGSRTLGTRMLQKGNSRRLRLRGGYAGTTTGASVMNEVLVKQDLTRWLLLSAYIN